MFQGGGVYAISQEALRAIIQNRPFYVPEEECGNESSTPTTTSGSSSITELNYTNEGRSIKVTVYSPQGSGPLLMFAPGFAVSQSEYKQYLGDISAAGFVVAGVDFQDNATARGPSGHGNDITDMKFTIGELLNDSMVNGKINKSTGVGVFGHSDGTFTATGVASTDDRVSAFATANGPSGNASKPELLLFGTQQSSTTTDSFGNTVGNNPNAPYFAKVLFLGGDHWQYLQNHGAGFNSESAKVAAKVTATFFSIFLKGDSLANIKSSVEGVANIEVVERGQAIPDGSQSQPQTNPSSGSSVKKVFMLGDSITNGAHQKYRDVFKEKGVDSVFIDASRGRSWTGKGDSGGTTAEGTDAAAKDAIDRSEDTGAIKEADAIVIALGSNNGLSANPISEVISKIKEKNDKSPIYWVNTVNSSDLSKWSTMPLDTLGKFNQELDKQKSSAGYSVIDWYGAVDSAGDPNITPANDPNNLLASGDGLHPSPTGQDKLVNLVVNTVTQNSGSSSSEDESTSCTCSEGGSSTLSGDDNLSKIYNYLIGQGFKDFQAAGIIGNAYGESGGNLETDLVQFGFKNSRGEISVPGQPSSHDPENFPPPPGGYGLFGWTYDTYRSGPNSLPTFAKQRGGKISDLQIQLDYLMEVITNPNMVDQYIGRVAEKMKETTTVEEATTVFAKDFERFEVREGRDELGKRINKAKEVLDLVRSGGISSGSSLPTGDGASSNSDIVAAMNKVPEYWRNLIMDASSKYPNADPRLVATTLWLENRGWPDPHKTWAVSSAGAQGPWQFISSSWASMGQDGDGDGIKDPNNPKDAVLAAFVHNDNSAGKPIANEYDGNADSSFNKIVFERSHNNLLGYLSMYNGSGAPNGEKLASFPRNQNSDYVIMGYWLLATNFEKTWLTTNWNVFVDASDTTKPGSGVSSSGGGCVSGSITVGSATCGPISGEPIPYSQDMLTKYFGDPGEMSDHSSMDANLVSVDFLGKKVSANKIIEPCLTRVAQTLKSMNINYEIRMMGCYRFDSDNGSSNIGKRSYHTYGAACDINWDTNPWTHDLDYKYDLPQEYVDTFKNNGFKWGGDFKTVKDFMHFQFNNITE